MIMENMTRNFTLYIEPNTLTFQFERDFSLIESYNWMSNYWTLSFVLAFIYIILIHQGQKYMRDRPKLKLRGPLFLWNAMLTFVHIFGIVRALPTMIKFYNRVGFQAFIINDCPFECNGVVHFWCWIFIIFKALELIDTAFVVLRKQPLFFLHWYHHCTVLIFTWYLYSHLSSIGALFGTINSLVHALMYFYYSLKSLSIHVPRSVSMMLTIIQISQMVIGFTTNWYVYRLKQQGVICGVLYSDIWAACVIYASYFVLFMWYFYKAYIVKDSLIISKFKGEKIE